VSVPAPRPPDDPGAWYAPDVHRQETVHPNVLVTVRSESEGFAYETREPSLSIDGVAYSVDYNRSAARAWAREGCPKGPGRRFGSCDARDGVVVQERAGETTLLAVAFDVRVTTARGTYDATLVTRVVGDG